MKTADERAPAAQRSVEPGADENEQRRAALKLVSMPADLVPQRRAAEITQTHPSTLNAWVRTGEVTDYGRGERNGSRGSVPRLVSLAEVDWRANGSYSAQDAARRLGVAPCRPAQLAAAGLIEKRRGRYDRDDVDVLVMLLAIERANWITVRAAAKLVRRSGLGCATLAGTWNLVDSLALERRVRAKTPLIGRWRRLVSRVDVERVIAEGKRQPCICKPECSAPASLGRHYADGHAMAAANAALTDEERSANSLEWWASAEGERLRQRLATFGRSLAGTSRVEKLHTGRRRAEAERFAELRSYCDERGLTWLAGAAVELGRAQGAVLSRLKPVEERRFGGIRFTLYRVRDARRRARELFVSDSPWVKMHRDPDFVFDWALARWGDVERAKRVRQAVRERNARHAKIRTGLNHAAERHERWRGLLLTLQAKFPDEEPKRLLGDVALLDWQSHPEDWPRDRYPAKSSDTDDFVDGYVRREARERVKKALLRL